MPETQVTVRKNGPYKIEGEVTVYDYEGKAYPAQDGAVFLCRCGGSSRKPFCDGTHAKSGFSADETCGRAHDLDG